MLIRFILLLGLFAGFTRLMAQIDPHLRIEVDPRVNPWTHLNFHNDPDHFQFALVSDRTGGHRKGVFGDAVEKLNLLQPEFVMSVGDLIEGYLVDTNKLIPQWEEFDSLLQPLEMPFFYLPGNHDISNPSMRTLWEQRYGRRYYDFVYKNVLFITMDTNDGEGVMLSEEQVAYVKEVLAKHKDVRWTLLFMHHPIWGYGQLNGFDAIEAALADRDYTVFAGHTHQYLQSVRQDRNYYVLATTGGGSELRGPKFGEFDHVTWVTMGAAGPRIANLKLDGILRHNVLDSNEYKQARALVQAANWGHAVYATSDAPDWRQADPYTVQLRLQNTGNRPMQFQGRFYHHHRLDPDLSQLAATVAPGSTEVFTLRISPRPGRIPEAPEPLALDWTLSYEQPPQQPPFALEGTHLLTLASSEQLIRFTEASVFLDSHQITLSSLFPDAALHYTLDGTEPTAASPRYQEPLILTESRTVKARLVRGKEQTEVFSQSYERVSPRPAIKVRKPKPGLAYQYIEGDFITMPDFDAFPLIQEGITQDFDLKQIARRQDHYGIRFSGYVRVPETGVYTFYTYSDDGSLLFIGDQLVVDNDGSHAARYRRGRVALEAGWHPVRIDYFEDFEGETLRVGYQLGEGEPVSLSGSFFHRNK